ncbi:MAG: DUF554 domain-containing protein [Candidatus Dormibacteraeota bacterium]|nr:DUF554 domain-containing protein [Candidatus Dormibacteraeota bacterium]
MVHGLGTLLNTATVLLGGAVGLTLSQRISGSLQQTMRAAIGLFTAVIGIQMALKTHNALILLLSLLGGVVVGEILRLDDRVAALGRWVEHRLARRAEPGRVSLGFVTASLLFCVGPLAILGSFEDGTRGNITLLTIKSTLDGFSAIVLAAALGWGVLLSALSVLVIQGSLTLVAALANAGLDDAQVAEVTAVGGIAVLAIALGLLELKPIKVVNLLPALVLAPILVPVLTPLLARLR